MLCTYARATRMHSARKDRAPLLETRPASREKQFEKALRPPILHRSTDVFLRDPLGRLACLSAPAERRPMQKCTSFPAAKRALGWRLECVPIHAIIITKSTFPPMWVVRDPYEETALLTLARCMQKRHQNPDRTALRRALIDLFAMGITA
jgi:hypothetical protein